MGIGSSAPKMCFFATRGSTYAWCFLDAKGCESFLAGAIEQSFKHHLEKSYILVIIMQVTWLFE